MLACYFLVSAAFLWSKAPALRFLSPPHTHGSSASACAGDSLAGGGGGGRGDSPRTPEEDAEPRSLSPGPVFTFTGGGA